jgi:cytochrome c553
LCALLVVALSCWAGAARAEDAIGGDMVVTRNLKPWDGCGECHDLDGVAPNGHFPNLAGQKTAYFLKQMDDFRTGKRQNDHGQMGVSSRETTGKALGAVVAYFAALPPSAPQSASGLSPTEIALAKVLLAQGSPAEKVPACFGCHSIAPKHDFVVPCLEAQQAGYLEKQLDDFKTGKRTNDPESVMQKIARRLSDADATAIAVYLGSTSRGATCGVTP